MKIIAADIYVVPTGNRRAVLLNLETDAGISGIGEAGVAYGMGSTAAAELLRTTVERFVIGRDPSPVERIWSDIYDHSFWTKGGGALSTSALSAIDHALWDIKGKTLGVPVHSLLGGPFADSLEVYANGWWLDCHTGDEYAEAALKMVDRGYTALKLYPLGMPDPVTVVRHPVRRALTPDALEHVVERIEVLRHRLGDGVELLLDFGGGLTMDQLRRLLARIEPFHPGFVEEPVDPAIPQAMSAVRQMTSIPLAAGERVYTRYGFHELLQSNAVDIIQPDVCNTGGLSEAKKISAMAEIYNVRVAPHNYGSTLATAVSAQLCAAIPNFMVLECFPDHHLEPGYTSVLLNPLEDTLISGRLPVPEAPGLGVELSLETIAPHRWARVTSAEPETTHSGGVLTAKGGGIS
ncbi:mandelate racemase/muconate lactonizing enzyme family protein [Cucumibacter marinus]|uniref:mandelate racemase/muconate lactonizing enzyme family protein n=1 Tax=Cucumibacter marinus TaxID=1121252 RepID=UPI00041A2BE5|nr:mandelate racemase/muconate lactonizing enzyme family protein [Cucumibacter marinus]